MYIYISLFTYLYTSYIKTCIHIYTFVPTCSSMVLPGGQGGAADPQERAQGGAADPLAATQCRPGPYSGSDGTRGNRRKQSRAASPETLSIFGGVLPAQVESGSELVKTCSSPKSLRRLHTKPLNKLRVLMLAGDRILDWLTDPSTKKPESIIFALTSKDAVGSTDTADSGRWVRAGRKSPKALGLPVPSGHLGDSLLAFGGAAFGIIPAIFPDRKIPDRRAVRSECCPRAQVRRASAGAGPLASQAPPALRLPLAARCAASCSRKCGKQVRQASAQRLR